MAKKAEIDPAQVELFVGGRRSDDRPSTAIRSWQEIEENPSLRNAYMSLEDGAPAVNVLRRAEYLSQALTGFGQMSQIENGLIPNKDREPVRSDLRRHYGRGAGRVVAQAREKLSRRLENAKRDFWVASGYTALRGSQVQIVEDPHKLDEMAREDWFDFSDRFHPEIDETLDREERKSKVTAVNDERQEYKRKLAAQSAAQRKAIKVLGLDKKDITKEQAA